MPLRRELRFPTFKVAPGLIRLHSWLAIRRCGISRSGRASSPRLSSPPLWGHSCSSVHRTESNDICIPDPSVSKLHARVTVEGYVLSDAGSTNGTFVGEKRLRPGLGVPLQAKLKLRFGDRTFQVYSSEGLYGVLHTVRAT